MYGETTSGDGGRTILVAGTASHVGKSTVATGLCRLLADRGVSVAPFKAQNMSNNARAVATADGEGWGEVGVSQYVQARAARTAPTTDVNPVLLKPRGEGESQLVVDGEAVGHVEAGSYYDEHWADARDAAERAHARLAADHDVVVAEGAGSIAEINLRHRDLANLETARFADADVLLVADIERGGVFASLYGTLELMPDDVRERVVGAVVTKFRGDPSLLTDGIDELESRTEVPVLGVVPHDDPGLPEEDSVSLPDVDERDVVGTDDGVPPDQCITVGAVRLPRVSNVTDLEPLARTPGVRVAYLPPDASLDVDALVLPGTKNTVDDLLALREAGFGDRLRAFDGPVVGVCGGYQLLGERILNADVEGTGDVHAVEGFGLLPVETVFSATKTVEAVTRNLAVADAESPLSDAEGRVSGYEIHMGDTRPVRPDVDLHAPLGPDSAADGRVLGTYLHGLFENDVAREAFVDAVYRSADRIRPETNPERRNPFDAAADLLRDHVSLDPLSLPEVRG